MANNVGEQIGASAKDALGAVSALAVNPVGGLSSAYSALGPARALGAGAALCVIFALLGALGAAIGSERMMMTFGIGLADVMESNWFSIFLKTFFSMLVLPAAMVATSLGARKVLSGSGPLAADLFTVGAALTPLGIAILLTSFLGLGNYELSMLLLVFASCYLVLMLFAGLTRLGGLTEKAAAPAVPIVFVISLYICKVVLTSMM